MSLSINTRAVHLSGAALLLLAIWLIIAFNIPARSFWGLDPGLKVLAASAISEQGTLDYSLPDSDNGLTGSREFSPYVFPFVLERERKLKTVFSPLYIIILSLCWQIGGLNAIKYFSILLLFCTFPLVYRFADKLIENKISSHLRAYFPFLLWLCTPLLFYSFVIWEYLLLLIFILSSLILRVSTNSVNVNLSGFIAGLAVSLRPEALFWMVASLHFQKKDNWKYVLGIVPGLLTVLLLEFAVNGSLIPLQWQVNYREGVFTFAKAWHSFKYQAGLLEMNFGWIILLVVLLLLMVTRLKNLKIRFYATITVFLIYSAIWGYRLYHGIHAGNLSTAGGLFGAMPLFMFWIISKNRNDYDSGLKRVLIIFLLLALFTNPVPIGVHWGARMLIPAIVIGTLMFFTQLCEGRKLERISKYLLIGIAILIQLLPVNALIEQKNDNAEKCYQVSNINKDYPLVLSAWYQGGDLGPFIYGISAYYPNNSDKRLELVNHFKSAGFEAFYFLGVGSSVSLPDGAELVADGEHWHLLKYQLPD